MSIKGKWRSDNPTEKQITTILNLNSVLNWKINIPKTKGECSDLIGKLLPSVSDKIAYGNHTHSLSEEIDDDYMDNDHLGVYESYDWGDFHDMF